MDPEAVFALGWNIGAATLRVGIGGGGGAIFIGLKASAFGFVFCEINLVAGVVGDVALMLPVVSTKSPATLVAEGAGHEITESSRGPMDGMKAGAETSSVALGSKTGASALSVEKTSLLLASLTEVGTKICAAAFSFFSSSGCFVSIKRSSCAGAEALFEIELSQ